MPVDFIPRAVDLEFVVGIVGLNGVTGLPRRVNPQYGERYSGVANGWSGACSISQETNEEASKTQSREMLSLHINDWRKGLWSRINRHRLDNERAIHDCSDKLAAVIRNSLYTCVALHRSK